MTDPAQIARGLSKAQRDAFLNAHDMMSNHGGYAFMTVKCTDEPWPEGVAQFLTLSRDRLTPLGLAVRAELEKMAATSP